MELDYSTESDGSTEYHDFSIRLNGRGVATAEFEYMSMKRDLIRCRKDPKKKGIYLQNFESSKKGVGRVLLCEALTLLRRLGFVNVILHAVPKKSKGGLKNLISYYKAIGFRTCDQKDFLVGNINTVLFKCRRSRTM